jgi:phosphate:Na+ symporter
LPTISVLAPLLTGLGLFFCGVRFIAANLTPLAGPAARRLFQGAVRTSWAAAIAGIVAGLVSQSTSAVTLVVVSLVRAGIVPEGRAVLLPVWSQVGAAALVIIVSLQTGPAVALALAVAGGILYFDLKLSERVRHGVHVLLGVGLLFLGMETLNVDSAPLRSWLSGEGLLDKGENVVVLLLLGLALAAITQSSTVAGAFAVAIVRAGIFDLGAALALLVGASVGSAINYGVPGWRGESVGRKVQMFQAAQKLFGASLLALLLILTSGRPQALLAGLSLSPAASFAWVFLLVQVGGSLLCTLFWQPLAQLLDRLAPPKASEALGRPAYLLDEALADPELALELVEREERRLLQRLPSMLDGVRTEGADGGFTADALRAAGLGVSDAIRRYLEAILESDPGHHAVVLAMRRQRVLDNTVALHDAVGEFQRAVRAAQAEAGEAVGRMVESLHLLLEVLVDVASTRDHVEQEMSLALLGDRRQVIEGLRSRLMKASKDPKVQEALFRSTVLFERIVWLSRDTAVAMMRSSSDAAGAETAEPEPLLAPTEASA